MLHNAIAPDLLDLIDTGSPGDIDFYCQYARHRGGPVLVLLCGTGRVAIPIAKQGIPVIAVDSDAANMEYGKRKAQLAQVSRIMFVRADPTNFVSDSKHPLVILPGGALQRLLTLEEQRQALLAVRSALALGGKLMLDLPILDPAAVQSAAPIIRAAASQDDRSAVVHRHRRYDPTRQLIQETIAYEWLDGDGTVESKQYATLTERYSTPAEVELLLELTGFVPVAYGSFDRRALLPGASRLVIEAERRA